MHTVATSFSSRGAASLAALLRRDIMKGVPPGGELLPSVRTLAKTHRIGTKTVRLGLRILESEGLARPENRRGYRVLAHANDPERGNPLAFVVSGDNYPSFYGDLLRAMQDAAAQRKWSLLGVERDGRSIGEIVTHLRAAHASGAVVDSTDSELLDEILRLGLPVVMADTWLPSCRCDAVVQDGFNGAMLGAEWLAQRGHKRIAYVGLTPRGAPISILERYAGAVAGLARAGLSFDPADVVYVPPRDKDAEVAAIERLLTRSNRPTAVLAPWQGIGLVVAQVARALGLVIGKDMDLVGWSLQESANPRELLDAAGADSTLATVTWSTSEMADLCLTRLMQRRATPGLPCSMTRVPVCLRVLGSRRSD